MILVPFVEIDGIRTLSDSHLKQAYAKTVSDGTHTAVFSDGKVRSPDDFVSLMKDSRNLPVFIFDDSRMLGYAWINSICDNHAFAHFNFFKETWGAESKEMGKMLLEYWFSFPGTNGSLLDVIIGMIPKFNSRAINFTRKIGFERVGEIPNMLLNAYAGKREPAVILYKVR